MPLSHQLKKNGEMEELRCCWERDRTSTPHNVLDKYVPLHTTRTGRQRCLQQINQQEMRHPWYHLTFGSEGMLSWTIYCSLKQTSGSIFQMSVRLEPISVYSVLRSGTLIVQKLSLMSNSNLSRHNFCLIYPLHLLRRICLCCVCNCLSSTHRLLLVPS